jgi:hypothetical protein
MMVSTRDKLIMGFQHSSIPKVTGEPTFEDLKIIRQLLITNAISVSSYEGGERHGHLELVMPNAEYFMVATDVFPPSVNPGAAPTIVASMTATQITKTNRLHAKVYGTNHNVDQAFKKLIIYAFEDPYLNALSDEIVGYANCASLQFDSRLLTYYAMLSPTELTINYERLNTPYDPCQPVENLFQHIQYARAFVVVG